MQVIGRAVFAALSGITLASCGLSEGAHTVPSVDEKLQMLSQFNEKWAGGCSKAWLELEETEDAEFLGGTVQVCSGSLSADTPHVIVLLKDDGAQSVAGTMRVLMRHEPYPLAYAQIRDMVLDAGGVTDEADRERLNVELLRFQSSGQTYPAQTSTPTFYPLEYDGVGSDIVVAPNHPRSGWMTVQVNAP